ncbi:methionyl-tRNA synthetase-like protein [Xylaria cf. heliscus]|nr:methionyl-tRNA synthetase-like protein [Xylaria cf. heliscus]
MGSSTNTPLLPEPGKKNILITSALPYCNNVPHLGNIIGSVLSADCFARFSRARGLNTLFICGTDEYGTASETKAIEEKVTPAELCAKYHEIHKHIYETFCLSFDIYGHTSTEQHTQIVQSVFTKLWENGFIEERSSVQPYCTVHQSFLADRFIEGTCSLCNSAGARGDQCDTCGNMLDPFEQVTEANDKAGQEEEKREGTTGFLIDPRCKLDGSSPERRITKHLYLRLDILEKEIDTWHQTTQHLWSSNAVSITGNYMRSHPQPRPITRDLKWGVPIPKGLKGLSDEEYGQKVFYVWFDACIGYPSITKIYTDGDDPSGTNWEKWWKNPKDVTLYQFMGKDNVNFHSVVFPGSQIGTREDWTQVSRLSATEYLNYESTKFSKSRNIGVFGTAVKDTGVDIDVWRFYLLRHRPEGSSDTEFIWEEFVRQSNTELLNNFGNLCNRFLKFRYAYAIDKDTGKKVTVNEETSKENTGKEETTGTVHVITDAVPDNKYTDELLEKLKDDVNEKLQEYLHNMDILKLGRGAQNILDISRLGNNFAHQLFQNKDDEDKLKAGVHLALNLIHLLANLVCPYMPNIASSILSQLGIPKEKQTFSIPDAWTGDALAPGHKLSTAIPLFSHIPNSRVKEWKEAYGGDELKKKKAEEAAKAAAKKAAKQKKKEAENAKKAAANSSAPSI